MIAKQDTHALDIPSRDRTARIASLNDALRRGEGSGRLAVTAGVLALAQGSLPVIFRQIAAFDAFTAKSDPHGEHDFGALEWQGVRVFWKVDCYDRNLEYGSPDPTDPAVTTRVLTIMLASEY